jgi:hypothetical protein
MPRTEEEAAEKASDKQTPEDSNRAANRIALVLLEWIIV